MRAKLRKARKTASSLSKREKMRQKPLSLPFDFAYGSTFAHHPERCRMGGPEHVEGRKNFSIWLRLRYMAWSYGQGRRRLLLGGTTGRKPTSRASWRVLLSSSARSMRRCSGVGSGPMPPRSSRPSTASEAWPGERANLCSKGSVEGKWAYTLDCRRVKKIIPGYTITAHINIRVTPRGFGR
jgi:hypothetical protein